MRTIHKFALKGQSRTIVVPGYLKILHVDMQRDDLCIWIEVQNDTGTVMSVDFELVGTGHPIPHDMEHAGTVQVGQYVWHLYYKTRA